MANPSGDVYEDIAEIWRVVESLSTAARMPQISQDGGLKVDRDTGGISGTSGTVWGPLAGGTVSPSVTVRVPRSRRLLCQFGAKAAVVTSTAPNNYEMAAMTVQIPLIHAANAGDQAQLYAATPSSVIYANISNTVVIEVLDPKQPGDEVTINTVFSHLNPSGSVSHHFQYPWLIVTPL